MCRFDGRREFFRNQTSGKPRRPNKSAARVRVRHAILDGCVRLIDIPLNYCRLGRGQGPKASQKLKSFRKGKGERLASLKSYWQRSEEHTSELQSLMRISYAVFCLTKNKTL